MKILLVAINAKYIHTNLAVRYLKNYAYTQGFSTEIAEYTINHHFDDILGDIYPQKPDVIAFSCYLWNIALVRRLCTELKKLLPGTRLWCGGPEVTYHSEDFLKENPAVDLVMRGEGEEIFVELLRAVQQNGFLSHIRGIVLREGASSFCTPPAPDFDMARLPFAYDDLEDVSSRILYFESSRGCPYSCSYCLSSLSRCVHKMPVDLACKYLSRFLDAKVSQVKFVDRTFNCDKNHANAILNFLLEHDNDVTNFHFEISADILDDSTLAIIAQAREGLFQFEVGVQSTNPQTIQAIRRSCNNEKLWQKVSKLQENRNVHVHEDLIAGLPYEDYASFARSFDEVFLHRPDMLQLGFLKVLKGSAMEEDCKKYGMLYQSAAPYEILSTPWLCYDEILRLKKIEALNDSYYNSGRFLTSLPEAMAPYSSPFRFYEDLAAYFTKHHLFDKNAGKYDYYTFLYQFVIQTHGENERLQWLARHDMFRRENAKNVPSFAAISLAYQYGRQIEAFFEKEENIRGYLPSFLGEEPKRIARTAHMEVYPFSPLTGKPGTTALLYDYSSKDFLHNGWVTDVTALVLG